MSNRSITMANDDHEVALQRFFTNIFVYMALGVLATALISLYLASEPGIMESLFRTFKETNAEGELVTTFGASTLWWGLAIFEFILVFVIVHGTIFLPGTVSLCLFFVYSALNGVTLSPVLYAYSGADATTAFFVSATVFGVAAVYGRIGKKDLTGLGHYVVIGLISLIVAMVINIFLQNTFMDFVISAGAVVLFTGLTAFDVQKLAKMHSEQYGESEFSLVVYGALNLYLDFINLFLHVLKLIVMGKK